MTAETPGISEQAAPGQFEFNETLLTEEVQEIISYRPHWIVRKGNAIFLLVLLLMLVLTTVIRYPDIIHSSARLVSINPPKLINAKTSGKLERLFVKEEQVVSKGSHLGYIESTANYNQVMQLQTWIGQAIMTTHTNGHDDLLSKPLTSFTGLGELQSKYQEFQNQWKLWKQTLANGYYQKRKRNLQSDLIQLATLKQHTMRQKELQQQDRKLQQKEFDAYEHLAKDKVIAPLELNQYKSRLIAKEQSMEQLEAVLTSSEISSLAKQKEILELEKQVTDQYQLFYSALLALKSAIEKWIQQYVLVAPEEGKLLFLSSIRENEWIEGNQSLFYIQPDQTEFYVEIMAGQQCIGKVRTGQQVKIKVEGYPVSEFGYLAGDITHISTIPSRSDSFLLKARLPKGLQTNYGKPVFFRNGLKGEAEIVTDDRRLFDRLAGQLREIWKR
mgnify:CR=1 FL=1